MRPSGGSRRARDGVSGVRAAISGALRLDATAAHSRDAAVGHVAIREGDAARGRRTAGLVRRGPHADARRATARQGARCAASLDQGRRPQSHGVVQGAWNEHGGYASACARCAGVRRTDGRECGGRTRRLWGRRPTAGASLRTGGHAASHPRHDLRLRRGIATRAGTHRGCGDAGARLRRRERLFRRLDVARALSHRGKEDDGHRDRRTSWLALADTHRLSDGGRHGTHRHVEGLCRNARVAVARLRGGATEDDCRSGGGVRADRARVSCRPRACHAVGESGNAREWTSRSWAVGRSLDTSRAP